MTRLRAPWTDESGAELVEFALSLPLLLLVGLGIFDFGLVFQRFEVVTNAAREGARIGVLPGYTDADVVLRVGDYVAAAGLNRTLAGTSIDHPSIAVGPCSVASTAVTVTYPHTYSMVGGIASYFGVTGLSTTTITGTAQMRNEVPAAICAGP